MKVIGFCGLPGSGKSTAMEAISDLGTIITMGDVIRNEAKIRGIEPTDVNLGKIANNLRNEGGQEIIAKMCVELINNLKCDVIFVDGVRSIAEINIFRKSWKFPLIATVIDENIRFKRLYERGRRDDPKTISELRERDKREIHFGLKDVIKKAEYKIENSSTIEDLKNKTRRIVLGIINNY
ncbi:MAG: AAA family ATPase [Candidatus Hodarchaeota archaeon]